MGREEDPWPDQPFVAGAVIPGCSYPCDFDSSFIFNRCTIDTGGGGGVPTAFNLLMSVIHGPAKSVSVC